LGFISCTEWYVVLFVGDFFLTFFLKKDKSNAKLEVEIVLPQPAKVYEISVRGAGDCRMDVWTGPYSDFMTLSLQGIDIPRVDISTPPLCYSLASSPWTSYSTNNNYSSPPLARIVRLSFRPAPPTTPVVIVLGKFVGGETSESKTRLAVTHAVDCVLANLEGKRDLNVKLGNSNNAENPLNTTSMEQYRVTPITY
jgi:hypothetical protein